VRAILVLAALGVAAWMGAQASAETQSPSCPATTVRYVSAKHPTLGELPWVLAEPDTTGVAGFLPAYPRSLRDGRVNRPDGLVLWESGGRIVWSGFEPSSRPTVVAQRIDGRGSFRVPVTAGAVSTPRFPRAGCWRLTIRSGATEASVVARVVAPPAQASCDATPSEPEGLSFVARPRSAGIAGGWGWRTPENGALMYTHGIGPGDLNAKVPWWVRRSWGQTLQLTGIRLDGDGLFRQQFTLALEMTSHPSGYRAVFPSIVDVPAPGCWLLRLRTGSVAGVLVVRAIDR
jgi:hypothetical protein